MSEEEVWPSSSPDCHSFRYFLWGESELWVIAKSCNKIEDLIQKIKDVMVFFNRDTVAKACKSLRARTRLSLLLTAVVTADGSFNN